MLDFKGYKPYDVYELRSEYMKRTHADNNGYIHVGDYVVVQDREYYLVQPYSKTAYDTLFIASKVLRVMQTCKVAENTWYVTVTDNDKDYVLADYDIALVLRK